MRSYCGVTIGNDWLYNNPDINYPEGHLLMTEQELLNAVKIDNTLCYNVPDIKKGDKVWLVCGKTCRFVKVLGIWRDDMKVKGASSTYYMKKRTFYTALDKFYSFGGGIL